MQHGLVDELQLWIHPFLVGAASTDALLFRPSSLTMLELAGTRTVGSGIVILTDAFEGAAGRGR